MLKQILREGQLQPIQSSWRSRRSIGWLLLLALLFSALVISWPFLNSITQPSNASNLEQLQYWHAYTQLLVANHQLPPPVASRVYALLSIAQYRAARAPEPAETIDSATATLLNLLFPNEKVQPQLPTSELGNQLGLLVYQERLNDNAQTVIEQQATAPGVAPLLRNVWRPANNPKLPGGVLPLWGTVKPFYIKNAAQFRPAPPPDFYSPEFTAALQEVARLANQGEVKDLANVRYWADGAGSITPPGHWDQLAIQILQQEHSSLAKATEVLYVLNTTLFDTSIAVWEAKYHYNVIRPSQANPDIPTPVGLPNFPAYPSGHASFSAAAATILGHYFPERRDKLWEMAESASDSRIYGGIHYRFDATAGLELGRSLADWALASQLMHTP